MGAAATRLVLFASLAALSTLVAHAGTITITGVLSQVTVIRPLPASATTRGSAVSQPAEGDPYSLSLVFDGAITDAGNYQFDQMSLTFTAGSGFSLQSDFAETDLSITLSGQDAIFSIFACSTGSSPCIDGHRLDLDFSVPADSITGETKQVSTVSDFGPFDLLVHDTPPIDYIGSVDHYAYSPAPEPAPIGLSAVGVLTLLIRVRRRGKPVASWRSLSPAGIAGFETTRTLE
jgi:hypothetical protein